MAAAWEGMTMPSPGETVRVRGVVIAPWVTQLDSQGRPLLVVKVNADKIWVRREDVVTDAPWWHRIIYRLTHAGQWATPEWNLDPEPNMGPPWPETEKEKTP